MAEKKIDKKDIVSRALKTFAQAFVALIAAQVSGISFTADNWKSVLLNLLVSAGAAGLSAVWNGVIQPLLVIEQNR